LRAREPRRDQAGSRSGREQRAARHYRLAVLTRHRSSSGDLALVMFVLDDLKNGGMMGQFGWSDKPAERR